MKSTFNAKTYVHDPSEVGVVAASWLNRQKSVYGWDCEEIADMLNISISSVYRYLDLELPVCRKSRAFESLVNWYLNEASYGSDEAAVSTKDTCDKVSEEPKVRSDAVVTFTACSDGVCDGSTNYVYSNYKHILEDLTLNKLADLLWVFYRAGTASANGKCNELSRESIREHLASEWPSPNLSLCL